MIQRDRPADYDAWLAALNDAQVTCVHDEALAEILRAAAIANESSVCLCSGQAVLPFVNWIRDGMGMDSRLVIHLPSAKRDFDELVQIMLDGDIRIASHFQDTEDFCNDISHHRLDLLVIECGIGEVDLIEKVFSLANDRAMIFVLADKNTQGALREKLSDDYFFAQAGAMQLAQLLTRKGVQHRLKRKSRGRRAS